MNDYNKIRNMTDEDLKIFLEGVKGRNVNICTRCGKTAKKVVKIYNKESIQMKSLCGLCNECYSSLLEHLELFDFVWDR